MVSKMDEVIVKHLCSNCPCGVRTMKSSHKVCPRITFPSSHSFSPCETCVCVCVCVCVWVGVCVCVCFCMCICKGVVVFLLCPPLYSMCVLECIVSKCVLCLYDSVNLYSVLLFVCVFVCLVSTFTTPWKKSSLSNVDCFHILASNIAVQFFFSSFFIHIAV
jgi:hypothetical protein